MPAIPSSIGPARLQPTAAGLSIVIPARFSWYTLLHAPLVAVLVLWYVQKAHENSTVVLVVFAAVVAFSLRKWWQDVVGEQTVTVNKIAITVRSNVGFFGREHIYFVKRICNLRFVRIVTSADRQAGLGNRPSLGYLTFYYESSTHRLAGRFTDSEAQELIALLESFAAAPLTGIHTAPDHPLPPQVIAEEVHRGRGAIILYGWLSCALYAICLPIDDIAAVHIVSTILALLALAVGILAECGYRYRFTPRGLEISTLGFPLRFIPVDQILHYEPAKWTPGDRWNFGIFGRRRSFVWGGPGLRIVTIDGQVYLGHEFPDKIVALLDQMKQSAAQSAAQPTAKAASAAAH